MSARPGIDRSLHSGSMHRMIQHTRPQHHVDSSGIRHSIRDSRPGSHGCAAERPSLARATTCVEPDEIQTEPKLRSLQLYRQFWKPLHPVRCASRETQALASSALIRDSGKPDPVNLFARASAVGDLPNEMLSLPAQQPLLRSGSLVLHRARAFWTYETRMEPRAGDLRLGPRQSCVQLLRRPGHQKPPWTSLPSAWACAATFSILPSPSAAR